MEITINNNNIDAAAPTTTRTPTDLRSVRGRYEVVHVKTIRSAENPVGGQWTRPNGLFARLLSFRRRWSFQHLLGINETGRGRRAIMLPVKKMKNKNNSSNDDTIPVLGEAVNVISLSALGGIVRLTVILRGDVIGLTATERLVQPTATELFQHQSYLSSNAIQALFDPPRIIVGKKGRFMNLSLGPRTSVVLDAPYVDDQLRLGLGGRSGTRFIFHRCSASDVEANEFRELLYRDPVGRIPILAFFGGLSFASAAIWPRRRMGYAGAILSFLIALLFATSGGGIERNDRSIGDSKHKYGQ